MTEKIADVTELAEELVTLSIDDKSISVPEGTVVVDAAKMAERDATRGPLLRVLERELGNDRPKGIEEVARVPTAEFAVPLSPEVFVQSDGIRVGKLGLCHSHGISFVFVFGKRLNILNLCLISTVTPP